MRKDKPSRTAYKVALGIVTLGAKPGMEDKLTTIEQEESVDLLSDAYVRTAEALRNAEEYITGQEVSLFKKIIAGELADFRQKLKRWRRHEVTLIGSKYFEYVEKAYQAAKRSIVATCSEHSIDMWNGRFGERLTSAHRSSGAKVTRFFVFETRKDNAINVFARIRRHRGALRLIVRMRIDVSGHLHTNACIRCQAPAAASREKNGCLTFLCPRGCLTFPGV